MSKFLPVQSVWKMTPQYSQIITKNRFPYHARVPNLPNLLPVQSVLRRRPGSAQSAPGDIFDLLNMPPGDALGLSSAQSAPGDVPGLSNLPTGPGISHLPNLSPEDVLDLPNLLSATPWGPSSVHLWLKDVFRKKNCVCKIGFG